MAQVSPAWEEISDFSKLARQIITKYPERFAELNADWIIGYGCTNKERPLKKPIYEMSGQSAPENFTNSKKYFVKVWMGDWDKLPDNIRVAIVFSALSRIDKENVENGKILPPDFKDQNIMVRTFGAGWQKNDKIPNLLKEDVEFQEENI